MISLIRVRRGGRTNGYGQYKDKGENRYQLFQNSPSRCWIAFTFGLLLLYNNGKKFSMRPGNAGSISERKRLCIAVPPARSQECLVCLRINFSRLRNFSSKSSVCCTITLLSTNRQIRLGIAISPFAVSEKFHTILSDVIAPTKTIPAKTAR